VINHFSPPPLSPTLLWSRRAKTGRKHFFFPFFFPPPPPPLTAAAAGPGGTAAAADTPPPFFFFFSLPSPLPPLIGVVQLLTARERRQDAQPTFFLLLPPSAGAGAGRSKPASFFSSLPRSHGRGFRRGDRRKEDAPFLFLFFPPPSFPLLLFFLSLVSGLLAARGEMTGGM